MNHYKKTEYGMTGAMAETELFGEVGQKINIDFKEWLQKKNELYMKQEAARQVVRENQTGDPHDPTPKFASDVYEKIIEIMIEDAGEENNSENYFKATERLKFFTAVNSPLDYAHKIDAFFEIDLGDNRFATIDLDAATYSKNDYKADVLVEVPAEGLDPKEDKKDWQDLVNITAASIIEKLNSKIKNHEVKRRRQN